MDFRLEEKIKIEAEYFCEALALLSQVTRRHIPEERP
jgi:hypothetical protein